MTSRRCQKLNSCSCECRLVAFRIRASTLGLLLARGKRETLVETLTCLQSHTSQQGMSAGRLPRLLLLCFRLCSLGLDRETTPFEGRGRNLKLFVSCVFWGILALPVSDPLYELESGILRGQKVSG